MIAGDAAAPGASRQSLEPCAGRDSAGAHGAGHALAGPDAVHEPEHIIREPGPNEEREPASRPVMYRVDEYGPVVAGLVDAATQGTGWLAMTGDIAREWEKLTGGALPPSVRSWLTRRPAALPRHGFRSTLVDGRAFFGPLARADLLPAPYPTDVARALEAARRAVAASGGAVSVDTVWGTTQADACLKLRSPDALSTNLNFLEKAGQLRLVRTAHRGTRGLRFYTTPDGPTRVPDMEQPMIHRRLRVVRAYWRIVGGRPFSTRALRLYANARRDGNALQNVRASSLSVTLQQLVRYGVLEVDRREGTAPLWVFATEWRALSEDERALRRMPALGTGRPGPAVDEPPARPAPSPLPTQGPRPSEASQDGALPGAPGPNGPTSATPTGGGRPAQAPATAPLRIREAAYVSDLRNAKALLRLTIEERAAESPDAARRAVLAHRPVTAADVEATAVRHPHMPVRGRSGLRRMLNAGSQYRTTLLTLPVLNVGRVGRDAYYMDAAASPEARAAAEAYVNALMVRAEIDVARYVRDARDLKHAWALDQSGVRVLGAAILSARTVALGRALDAAATGLERAVAHAERTRALLPEEAAAFRAELAELRTIADRIAACGPPNLGAGADDHRVDVTSDPGARVDATISHAAAVAELRAVAFAGARDVTTLHGSLRRAVRLLPTPAVGVAPCTRWEARRAQRAGAPSGVDRPTGDRQPGDGAPGALTADARTRRVLDRIAYIRYTVGRWGGPALAAFVARGGAAVGALRDPTVLVRVLRDPRAESYHPAAAAALGLFRDAASRRAVAAYLARAVARAHRADEGAEERPPRGVVIATTLAAYALGPLPFGEVATGLSARERKSLEAAADASWDPELQRAAVGALAAWDEGWTVQRLLMR